MTVSARALQWAVLAVLAVLSAPAAVLAQGPVPSPEDFAMAASASDTFEIVEAQYVLAQSTNGDVRSFAQQMLTDHGRTRAALEQAAAASGLHPPRAMDADQARMLMGLQAQKSPELDRTYLAQQVAAHQAAVDVESGYAAAGSDANLRKAAASAVPVIKHHLDMARALKAKLQAQ